MNIHALISLQATVKQAVKLPDLPQWQVGQLLKAVVESKTGKQQVTLKVGDGSLTTTLQVPVRIGDKLTLEVIKSGQLPVLRLLPEGSKVDRITQNLRQVLPQQRELAQFLSNIQRSASPRQQQPALPPNVLKVARNLIQSLPQAQDIRKPGILKQAIQQSGIFMESRLLNSRDRASTLNLASDFKANVIRLRESINQQLNNRTGVVRENGALNTLKPGISTPGKEGATLPSSNTAASKPLAENIRLPDARLGPGARPASEQTTATLGNPYAIAGAAAGRYASQARQNDNSGLAQLLKHLFPQPQARSEHHIRPGMTQEQLLAQLFKDTDSALARTQLSQLASQHTETEQRQLWILELPVRRGEGFDVFHVRIEKEAGNNQEEDPQQRWTVSLAFDLEELGPVHARVSLADERITSTLWIEREESLELFRNHLLELRNNMASAGLEVDELNLHAGSPVHIDEAEMMTDSKLVDYTA